MRARLELLVALLLVVFAAADAAAASCSLARQLKLVWSSERTEGLLSFTLGKCPLPADCSSAPGTPSTHMPLAISVRGESSTLFTATLSPCDTGKCSSTNSGGCPAGSDAHRSPAGLARIIYGVKGGVAVNARVRAPMSAPPDDSRAVTVSVKGAGGYSADAVFSRCRVGKGKTTVTMVCR